MCFFDKIEGSQFKHRTKQAELNYYATSATTNFIDTLRQTSETVYYDDEDSDTATLDLEYEETLEGRNREPESQSLICKLT